MLPPFNMWQVNELQVSLLSTRDGVSQAEAARAQAEVARAEAEAAAQRLAAHMRARYLI